MLLSDAAFAGCDSIPALVAMAGHAASSQLHADDVARLNGVDIQAPAQLAWLTSSELDRLARLVGGWADREVPLRYRLRKPERDALEKVLGVDFRSKARHLVVLVAQLGSSFGAFDTDYDHHEVRRVASAAGMMPAPRSFLADAENLPPPIGQMTAVAALRRWSAPFWPTLMPRELRAFGEIPDPRRIELPQRLRNVLQDAVDQQTMRIGVATWRHHAASDLVLDPRARAGTFAATGFAIPPADEALTGVIETLARWQVHLAVLPELMVDARQLDALRETLRTTARRYPSLMVVGRAHQRCPADERFLNCAVVLDSRGNILFEHEKVEPYTYVGVGMEDILPRLSRDYLFADTPVGRLAVNICRDVRSDVPMLLNRALGVSLLAVPAYSAGLDFVAEEARVLGQRQGAIVVAVNPLGAHLRDLAYLYAPVKGKDECEDVLRASVQPPATHAHVQVWTIDRTQNRRGRRATTFREAV